MSYSLLLLLCVCLVAVALIVLWQWSHRKSTPRWRAKLRRWIVSHIPGASPIVSTLHKPALLNWKITLLYDSIETAQAELSALSRSVAALDAETRSANTPANASSTQSKPPVMKSEPLPAPIVRTHRQQKKYRKRLGPKSVS